MGIEENDYLSLLGYYGMSQIDFGAYFGMSKAMTNHVFAGIRMMPVGTTEKFGRIYPTLLPTDMPAEMQGKIEEAEEKAAASWRKEKTLKVEGEERKLKKLKEKLSLAIGKHGAALNLLRLIAHERKALPQGTKHYPTEMSLLAKWETEALMTIEEFGPLAQQMLKNRITVQEKNIELLKSIE